MATTQTLITPGGIPPALARAATHQAGRCASLLVARYSSILRNDPDALALPRGYLLELGAICLLLDWERSGLMRRCPGSIVPTAVDAIADLLQRVEREPAQFQHESSATLMQHVLGAWVTHFAWDGPELMSADMFIADSTNGEDLWLDAVAELIWNYRHQNNEDV